VFEDKPEAERHNEEESRENRSSQEENKEERPAPRTTEEALSESRYRLRLAEIEN
jgi:hypothetical protein